MHEKKWLFLVILIFFNIFLYVAQIFYMEEEELLLDYF